MRLSPTDEGGLQLDRISDGLLNLLREVPNAGDPRGDSRAFDRLYPRPIEDSEDDFNDDWNELIQPDLQHLFESNNQTMQRDLDLARPGRKGWSVQIPGRHFDAWISALNQARLVLACRFKIEEEDMTAGASLLPSGPRDFALMQIELYGDLLDALIRLQMMDSEEE